MAESAADPRDPRPRDVDALAERESAEEGTPGQRTRRRAEGEFLLALRRTSAVTQLLGAAAAERIGINVTDLNCLNILALGGQMTAGDLARATGLTTASITGVLDRLEEAGFVRRERDPHDRRRVVIRLDATRGLRDVATVFDPVIHAWRATVASYTDEQLGLILEFHRQLEQIMRDALIEFRSGSST